MARETKPQFTEGSATDEQLLALEPFLAVVQEYPASVVDALSLLCEGGTDTEVAKPLNNILEIIRSVMESGVDLEVQPDHETVKAMHSAIKSIESSDSRERRLARLIVFATATQDWQVKHPAKKQPAQLPETQTQQGTSSAA